MSNRVTQYFLQEEKILQHRIEETRSRLTKDITGTNGCVINTLIGALDNAFKTALGLQKAKLKQPIAWIHLSYLQSSIQNGACELQIALYDKAHYLDLGAIYSYWVTPFIDVLLAEDRAYFAKMVRAKVVRTQEYEIQSFIRQCVLPTYFCCLRDISEASLPNLQNLGSYKELSKEEEITWMFGEIFGSSKPLKPRKGEIC